jgi:hypothetical protein
MPIILTLLLATLLATNTTAAPALCDTDEACALLCKADDTACTGGPED